MFDGVTDVLLRQYEFDVQNEADLSNGWKINCFKSMAHLRDIEDKVSVMSLKFSR